MTLSSSCSHTNHSKCTEEHDVPSLSLTQSVKQRVIALVSEWERKVGEKWNKWRFAWFPPDFD